MKWTSSIFVAVLVLSAAAFGQTTVKLGFLSNDKKTQFADFVQLTVEKNSIVVSGAHFPHPGCDSDSGGCFNGTMAGLLLDIPANSGQLVTGTVATFADNTLQQQSDMGLCGCSEYYVVRPRPSTAAEIKAGIFGWAHYINFGGEAVLQNFGFTTRVLGNSDPFAHHTFDEPLPPQP